MGINLIDAILWMKYNTIVDIEVSIMTSSTLKIKFAS